MRKIIFLVITFLLMLSSSTVLAKSSIIPNGDSMTDGPITIEQQEQNVLKDSSMSDEQKSLFKKRFEDHKALVAESQGDSMSILIANDPSGYISVPYFKQERNYWCGPATTKQSVHYIKGTSSSQSTIATAIHTTEAGSNLTDMVNYLNSKSADAYFITTSPSEGLIQNIAEYGVRNKVPPIARLKIAKGGNWAYSSAGHYMNVSGFKNYGAYIRVTDPYIGWITPSSSGTYFVTSNELYTATKNHFAKQMAY